MTEAELVVLLGKVRARASASAFNEPAWRRALGSLEPGRAGTAIVRHLSSLHRTDEPTIAGFLDLYGPLPTGHPLGSLDDRPARPPRPTAPCDVCSSTGWVEVDPHDPPAGVKPCSCPWGEQVAPTHRAIAFAPAPPPLRSMPAVPPPWVREGITAAEWQTRQINRAAS